MHNKGDDDKQGRGPWEIRIMSLFNWYIEVEVGSFVMNEIERSGKIELGKKTVEIRNN